MRSRQHLRSSLLRSEIRKIIRLHLRLRARAYVLAALLLPLLLPVRLAAGQFLRDRLLELQQQTAADALDLAAAKLPEFKIGEMKFPEFKIGETTIDPNQWLAEVQSIASAGTGPQSVEISPKPGQEHKFDKSRKYRVIGADQKVYGPIDGAKILDWIADGRIDWQTPSQIEGSGEWKPLSGWADSPAPPAIPLPPRIKPAPQLHKAKRR